MAGVVQPPYNQELLWQREEVAVITVPLLIEPNHMVVDCNLILVRYIVCTLNKYMAQPKVEEDIVMQSLLIKESLAWLASQ